MTTKTVPPYARDVYAEVMQYLFTHEYETIVPFINSLRADNNPEGQILRVLAFFSGTIQKAIGEDQ